MIKVRTSTGETQRPGLYVHVPFCQSKCRYCDFYSVASLGRVSDWLQGMQWEVQRYQGRFSEFDTLYLGGGTPTALSMQDLERLFSLLHEHFRFTADVEITVEANPDDVTGDLSACLWNLGVNRISLGVQSFDDQALRLLGRRHSAQQAEQALARFRQAGFANVGLDLMYGLPGQSEAAWRDQMAHAVALAPQHLSCYQLTLEAETPMGRMLQDGSLQALGEDMERSLFLQTSRFLEDHGYLHYEVSNFARADHLRSHHNCKYWQHVPYLGLGPAAHSFDNGQRWWNIDSLDGYCRALTDGGSAVAGREVLSKEQLRLETLFLGFRTSDGVALEALGSDSRTESVQTRLVADGLAHTTRGRLVPTAEGMVVADRLALEFSCTKGSEAHDQPTHHETSSGSHRTDT
jgi:oxygen-independent coproporphyrinogen III oxidase